MPEPHAANRTACNRDRAALPPDARAVRAPVVEHPEAVAREVLDVGMGARYGRVDGVFAVQERDVIAAQLVGASALDALEAGKAPHLQTAELYQIPAPTEFGRHGMCGRLDVYDVGARP